MDTICVGLIYLTPEEIQEKKANGDAVLELSEEFSKAICDKFYGGTLPMGKAPTALILSE